MSQPVPPGILSSEIDPATIRTGALITVPTYPFWHFLAPQGATDPWIVWWILSAYFLLIAVLPSWSAWARRNLQALFYSCGFLVSTQIFVLAHLNGMHTFFGVASALAVIFFGAVIRSHRVFLAYSTYILFLTGTLFALDPSWQKVAVWGPLATILPFYYVQLRARLAAAALLRRNHEELESRVAERTRELSAANLALRRTLDERASLEEQLRFSQKMEAVGRLAGGVAHDFNNLLTAIRGYGDLVLDALPGDHPARADVCEMEDAADRAAALTRQLLAFGRKGATETSVLDPDDLVRRMQPMLRTVMGEDVEVVVALHGGPHRIRANRAQIEQVILNLALNARDAMPAGGKFVLETRQVKEGEVLPDGLNGGAYVLIAASDTGVGMDDHTRLRIFEPFFTTKDVDKGTGMGLATVYGIVKQARGAVRVLSARGEGSRFELYWPAVSGAVDVEEVELPRASRRGHERILLVEDEDAVRRLAHRVLEGSGYTVIEARDAESALRIALDDEQSIDLIVTDVVMPNMSGFELAEKLASERPETRVLFISGHLEHPSLRSKPLPPGTTLLPKPFAPVELTNEVRATLDRPQG